MKGLSGKALAGVAWLFLQTLGTRGAQVFGQVALTWLLVPRDMGQVGLSYTVTTVAGALFGLGVTDVLMQRKKALRLWASEAFWVNQAFSTLGCAFALCLAPIMGRAYGIDLVGVASVIALTMLLDAVGAIPMTILRSRMCFRLLALTALAETVAMQAGTVALAWGGMGAYSFVLPAPVVVACRVAWFWKASGFDVRRPRLGRWRYLIRDSAAVLGSRVLITAVAQGDYFVLGFFASEAAVGVYYFAFKLAAQPLFAFANSINNVLFPTLVAMQGDLARQRAVAFKVAHVLNMAIMPACFLQAALAPTAMALFFPERWAGATVPLQILSVGLAFDGASWAAGTLLSARGEFVRSLKMSLACAPAFFVLVLAGAWTGAGLGVAVGVAVFYALAVPASAYLVFRGDGIGAARVLGMVYGTALVSAAAVAGGTYLSACMGFGGSGHLVASTAFSGMAYAAASWAVFPSVTREIATRLTSRLSRVTGFRRGVVANA